MGAPPLPTESTGLVSGADAKAEQPTRPLVSRACAVAVAVLLLLLVLIGIAVAYVLSSTPAAFELSIAHMNDHHSHVEAEDLSIPVPGYEGVTASVGGWPRLVTLMRLLEAEHPNLLKLHAGDAITGTLWFTIFDGGADAALMRMACFDGFALGNHEFDHGDQKLATFLDALGGTDETAGLQPNQLTGMDDFDFSWARVGGAWQRVTGVGNPTGHDALEAFEATQQAAAACKPPAVLCANLVPGASSPLRGKVQPYVVLERGGERVGVIGLDTAEKVNEASNPDKGTKVLDAAEVAQQYIDELTAAGVNKVVLLTHHGYDEDLRLAATLRDVDVVVGGDSHSLLRSDRLAEMGLNPNGPYPTTVSSGKGQAPVCVVQAWEYSHLVGVLSVHFDRRGVVTRCGGQQVVPVDAESFRRGRAEGVWKQLDTAGVKAALAHNPALRPVSADETATALVMSLRGRLDNATHTAVATFARDLCFDRFPGQGLSTLCQRKDTFKHGGEVPGMVARAMLEATPGADLALHNAGGCRRDIKQGAFSVADAYELLPFAETLVLLRMSGEQLQVALEETLTHAIDGGGGTGGYPYASGLRFAVDASAAAGARVSALEVNPRAKAQWAPIDPSATYVVVTNSFISAGKDGYPSLLTIDSPEDTRSELTQAFVNYLSTFDGPVPGLPEEEFSTTRYVSTSGCDHSATSKCDDPHWSRRSRLWTSAG